MIRMFAGHNTTHPPGSITLKDGIEEWEREQAYKTLQDAWNAGYRVGVQDGKKTSLEPLDPSSELDR